MLIVDPISQVKVAVAPCDSETAARALACKLDDNEHCEVAFLPVEGLKDALESCSKKGIQVDAKLYALAMNLNTI
jgi:hypothetical protein